jgi:hypothetical protein
MYTIFYRDIGIFHEHLANRILDDFVRPASLVGRRLKASLTPVEGSLPLYRVPISRDGSQLKAKLSLSRGQFSFVSRTVPE